MEDPEEHGPPPLDALESPQEPDEQGRQRVAAVPELEFERCTHPVVFQEYQPQ